MGGLCDGRDVYRSTDNRTWEQRQKDIMRGNRTQRRRERRKRKRESKTNA